MLAALSTPALAQSWCSGPGQPPCDCGFLCYDCDYVYLVLLNQCSDADGWPASCGGEGERPCTVTEHIPSCKSGLYEIPFPGGNCTRLDADGFPTFCGGVGERACAVNEHVPSCKTGLIEERGFCRAYDADGYPTTCGGQGEPACELAVQIIILKPSCKTGLVEERGICRAIDADGYPTSCGGTNEPSCDLVVQTLLGIPSCKSCHVEIPAVAGTCRLVGADRFPSTCGGCNEAACDVTVQAQTFQPACQSELTNVSGTCKRLGAGGQPIACAGLGEPGLGTTALPVTLSPGAPIRGFADLHAHPFSNMAFGGLVVWGSPFDPNGIASAVPQCDYACGFNAEEADGTPITPARFPLPPGAPVHGPGGVLDLFGAAGTGEVPHLHDVGGYPGFGGWPRHDEVSHQQMYHRWIERAFRGGMKLMVAHAVNNEVLCRLSKRRSGYACNDMLTVEDQIDAVKAMEVYIDQQSGGTGLGWFRIARSGAEAREIIESGRMAVVLGIEVDSLFDCGLASGCTVDDVRDRLESYRALGVRHLFPVHLFDNDFGGAAIYEDYFNIGNAILSDDFFSVGDCGGADVEFELGSLPDDLFSMLIRTAAELVLGLTIPPGSYPPGGHCNARGLTPLGESLVKLLMSGKMIIDVDHMSYRATDRALEIATDLDYPVVAGHTRFLDAYADNTGTNDHLRAEYAKLQRHVETIRDLGGLVAPLLHQGGDDEMRQIGPVPSDCSNSTKTWAQAYQYAIDLMRSGAEPAAVALGSDFNGGISPVGPRFGPGACEGEGHPDQGTGISYPFDAHEAPGSFSVLRTGTLDFDFNQVGLANVGLLPDFVEDLKVIGLTDEDLDPLFSSAEAYVGMWERIELKNLFPPTTAASLTPASTPRGWNNTAVTVDLSAVPAEDGWNASEIRFEAAGAQTIPPTVDTGSEAQAVISAEGETVLLYRAADAAGNVEPERSLPVRIDWTPPSVSYSGEKPTYQVDETISVACAASDSGSGVDPGDCLGIQAGAYAFPLGLNTVDVTATDAAGNAASAPVSFTVGVTTGSLHALTGMFVTRAKPRKALQALVAALDRPGLKPALRAKKVDRFKKKVTAQTGRSLTSDQAQVLIRLIDAV